MTIWSGHIVLFPPPPPPMFGPQLQQFPISAHPALYRGFPPVPEPTYTFSNGNTAYPNPGNDFVQGGFVGTPISGRMKQCEPASHFNPPPGFPRGGFRGGNGMSSPGPNGLPGPAADMGMPSASLAFSNTWNESGDQGGAFNMSRDTRTIQSPSSPSQAHDRRNSACSSGRLLGTLPEEDEVETPTAKPNRSP